MNGVVIERSTFRHVSTMFSEEAPTVRLLMITLIPFMSEFSVSIANEFDADMSRLVCKGSLDINCTSVPLIIQANVFEFPVAHIQVTVSPGHTDFLSQVIKGVPTKNNIVMQTDRLVFYTNNVQYFCHTNL